MATIPSRLAGMPEMLAYIMRSNRANAGEQRNVEKHQAWRENLAAVKAQAAQQAQMQRGALRQFNSDPNYKRILGEAQQIPYEVRNPEYDAWGAEGEDPPVDPMVMNETLTQNRAVTPEDKFDAHQLYSQAYGTNMPGASALAKILGASGQEPFVETQWNSDKGMPFGAKQRAGYSESMQDFINSAMADAMAKGPAGMKGSFGDRTDPIDLARKTIMQDVWTVARQIARQSALVDEGRAFQQILDAMAKGVIDPIQISQMAGKDAIEGDEGLRGYFTRNTRGLQAQPLSRDQLREQYETEYGPIGQANSLGLPPPN